MWTAAYQVVCCSYAIIIYIKVILYRMMKLQTIMFAPFPTYSILFMLYHIYIFISFSFKYKNLKCWTIKVSFECIYQITT